MGGGGGRGDLIECIVCVCGHDSLTISFLSFLFFDWVGVLWPHLSESVKSCALGRQRPFPPVSLQRQVVCLLRRPVFMCSFHGRAFTVVSWLVQIKVML